MQPPVDELYDSMAHEGMHGRADGVADRPKLDPSAIELDLLIGSPYVVHRAAAALHQVACAKSLLLWMKPPLAHGRGGNEATTRP
jgi:hypothetical protein